MDGLLRYGWLLLLLLLLLLLRIPLSQLGMDGLLIHQIYL
jgi:hypothetical protein